jgi:hypothetical protein
MHVICTLNIFLGSIIPFVAIQVMRMATRFYKFKFQWLGTDKNQMFLFSGETKIVKFRGVPNSIFFILVKKVSKKFGPKNCSTIEPLKAQFT